MFDPDANGLPDAVYARRLPDGTALVSLAYATDGVFPNTAETGYGVLLMEFEANHEIHSMVKSMRRNGRIEETQVNGMFGFWIEGSTDLQILGDESGPRASGNILLWQSNGVTYRMESALTKDEAIALAEEMTVVHPSRLTTTSEP
jgi:hypothetical protein